MKWLPLIKERAGATLVEVLVAMGIAGILLPALATAFVAANAGRPSTQQQLQATSLLREATEAVRVVREKGWSNIATDGTYFPAIVSNSWSLTAGTQTVNGFTRSIVISTPQRDASGNIVASGGTNDPSTKKIVATVSWTTPFSSSVSTEAYFTRWAGNTTWTQTTQATFNTGTRVNTVTTNTAGGEVQLATGPMPSWTSPQNVANFNISGNTDANDVYVDAATDRAYVVNGATLSIINIATPSAPVLLGTYNPAIQMNGVFVSGNYAYIASTNNTAELTIVNVSNPAAPTLAGSLNLGDTADANCIYVSGTTAYIGKVASATAGVNEFYVVNVSNPASPTLSGSLNLASDVNSVYVSGNYAYLATSVTTAELTIVNISNPAAPTSAGTFNTVGTTAIATDVFAVGTTVYLTESNNTSGGEFFILNASNPASVSQVGSYEAGAAVNGVYVNGTEAFLATAITGAQFRVLDISTPSAPTAKGSFNTANTMNDIVYDSTTNTAYAASTNNSGELAVFQRGSVAGGFQASGTYETTSFDPGATVSYNYITFTSTVPTNSTLQLQIATNTNNSTWNYVGPDGTAGTYFTAGDNIPLNSVSARYMRFKAYFTSDTTVTPVLNDVTVNYSP